MTRDIAIYGAGGLGREVLLLLRQLIRAGREDWNPLGFFDDGVEAGKMVHGLPVLGGLAAINRHPQPLAVALAIGDPQTRKRLVTAITSPRISYPTLVHPSAMWDEDQHIRAGEGCILGAGTTLTVDITLGRHVLLNLHTTVGHDAVIGDFCAMMPSVNIAGDVVLNEAVYVGTGATILPGVRVGPETVVGAGAVVVESLPGRCTAVGVPARPVKFHDQAL